MGVEELTLCEKGQCRSFDNIKVDSAGMSQMTGKQIDDMKRTICRLMANGMQEFPSEDCTFAVLRAENEMRIMEDSGEFNA